MTANEKRQAVVKKYNTILGRNKYSQSLRSYVFTKYKGNYYSDCSSSVAACYKAANLPIKSPGGSTLPNTVGMYQSKDLKDVPVTIKNGVIQNPEALRVGDLLLFAGTDSSRASAGYVGHVEMVHTISGSKITICGHGSGTPRKTEMNAYCKSRYSKKTSTKLGHKGLIKVRRRIQDDSTPGKGDEDMKKVIVTSTGANVRTGPGTQYESVGVVYKGNELPAVETNGWMPVEYKGNVRWISPKVAKAEG